MALFSVYLKFYSIQYFKKENSIIVTDWQVRMTKWAMKLDLRIVIDSYN